MPVESRLWWLTGWAWCAATGLGLFWFVYTEIAFEDTLVELEDVAKHAGFRVIAAVAAIAEHSIARQFAAGRPDAQDAAQLAEFAQQIQQKLLAEDASESSIPGNRPYKQAGGHRDRKSVV